MKSVRFYFTVFLFIGFVNNLTGQTIHQFSGWGAVFGNAKINNKFSLHLESQIRSNDDLKAVQTLIFRTGLIYNLKNNQTLTVGYAFVDHHRTIGDVSGWGPEHRIWEQYVLNKAFSLSDHFITIQNRFRLEQRFVSTSIIADNQLKTEDYNFSQRLRYFVRSIFPLVATHQKKFKQGAFLSLQDEIFLNLSDNPPTNGKLFDQNRAYASVGYRFSPKYDLEIGYMNHLIIGKADAKTINNIIQLAFYFRL
jgi:Protein of unknown function (DUF2490)